MTLADLAFAALVIGATCYLLFGGADFGAGLWHLAGTRGGGRDRAIVEHAVGPVWEANHVWLIFVLVLGWTAFPAAFAAVSAAAWVPLSLAMLGIVVRGAAFAFRKALASTEATATEGAETAATGEAAHTTPGEARPRSRGDFFGPAFAFSSLLTAYFLGTVAGGIATGRPGDWTSPTAAYSGTLTAGLCAYLAAVYLTSDARRLNEDAAAERFRRRALVAGCAVGALALAGPLVLTADAPGLSGAIVRRALPLVAVSAAAGIVSLLLLARRRYTAVRITAALAVATIPWGWVAARYPLVLPPSLTVDGAAAGPAVLRAVLAALGVGALLLIPSFGWLYALFQRAHPEE